MSEIQPDFIMIPQPVMVDESLKLNDKVLFGYIYWYTKLTLKKCVASNKKLSDLAGISASAVMKGLDRLETAGHIKRTYKDDKTREGREIFSNVGFTVVPPRQMATPPSPNGDTNKEYIKRKSPTEYETASGSGSTNKKDSTPPKKEESVLSRFYLVLKTHDIVVINNNHIKTWAKKLEEQTTFDNAMKYLHLLATIDFDGIKNAEWNQNPQDKAFVPTLNKPLDVLEKRIMFRNCLNKAAELADGFDMLPRRKTNGQ